MVWLCLLCLLCLAPTVSGAPMDHDAISKFATECGLPCPGGRCYFEDCEEGPSCKGGLCHFVRCKNPTCDGGACLFDECHHPTCKGGVCTLRKTATLIGDGYCSGGQCDVEGVPVDSNMRDNLAY